jgi:GT2 family glycosyltransferase
MTVENTVGPPPLLPPPDEVANDLARARVPASVSALVSVVVPCCGQLEYTRLCIPSLLRHSRRPYELIFVDVGSLDGTPEFLAGVAAAAAVRVEVIHVAAEAGFQAACTEGLARAGGEFVVWLNNDVLVTDGWLQQLVALASVNAAIGVVGPMSNYAPQAQRAAPVPYRLRTRRGDPAVKGGVDVEALERFAGEWREQHKGQWFEADRLGGFCLLIKRAVLQKVSLFEEPLELGVLDANAFSWRVRQAGFRCVCCRDLFVHHFGSRIVAAG